MFGPLLSWLGSLIGGPFIQAALDAYRAKLAAGTSSEKIAADLTARELEIKAQLDALNTQILIAEQGRWYTASIRPLFALPFIVFNLKVVIWDVILGWGVTAQLNPQLLNIESVVIAGYFGASAIENAVRIFKR